MSKLDLKFILAGTGRCGSVYAAKLLTSAGVPCCHEGIFTPAGLKRAKQVIKQGKVETSYVSNFEDKGWLTETPMAESSYMAVPFLHEFPDSKIVHLIRNPINVIGSFHFDVGIFRNDWPDTQMQYREFIFTHMPKLSVIRDEILRAAYYVVEWNRRIMKQNPAFTFRVEDSPDALLEFVQAEKRYDLFNDTKANSWVQQDRFGMKNKKHIKLRLADIEDGEIKKSLIEFMKEFNYNYPKHI